MIYCTYWHFLEIFHQKYEQVVLFKPTCIYTVIRHNSSVSLSSVFFNRSVLVILIHQTDLQSLQRFPINPSWQPLMHVPLIWSQDFFSKQCLEHVLSHPIPKNPGKHSRNQGTHVYVHWKITYYHLITACSRIRCGCWNRTFPVKNFNI